MKVSYTFCLFINLIFSQIHSVDRTTWESSHYLWDFGLIAACDKGMIKTPADYFANEPAFNKAAYQDIKAGDVVWIQCQFMNQFCQQVLPELTCSIVLLISDGDESFPSDCSTDFNIENLLNHPNIVHVFAQNNDYTGPSKKISHLSIGMDLHTIAYKGVRGGWGEQGSPQEQEVQLNTILEQLKPTYARKKKAFVDFHHADTMHGEFKRYLKWGEDRRSIFERLLPTGLIEYGSWMRRSQLWKTKGQYAFSISPHGNGLDCHRTWEDLVLGCIVIVKTSPLDPLYEGLPVVIVNDWSEITQENMNSWLVQYGDAFTNPLYRNKLTLEYWISQIQTMTQPFKDNRSR